MFISDSLTKPPTLRLTLLEPTLNINLAGITNTQMNTNEQNAHKQYLRMRVKYLQKKRRELALIAQQYSDMQLTSPTVLAIDQEIEEIFKKNQLDKANEYLDQHTLNREQLKYLINSQYLSRFTEGFGKIESNYYLARYFNRLF